MKRITFVATALCAVMSFAGELQMSGAAVFARNKDAIVTVKVVLNQTVSMSGR